MPQAITPTDYRLRFASVSHIAALRPTVTAMLESVTFPAANFAAVIHIAVFVEVHTNSCLAKLSA